MSELQYYVDCGTVATPKSFMTLVAPAFFVVRKCISRNINRMQGQASLSVCKKRDINLVNTKEFIQVEIRYQQPVLCTIYHNYHSGHLLFGKIMHNKRDRKFDEIYYYHIKKVYINLCDNQ